MNCSIHLNWLVNDLTYNIPTPEAKVWKIEQRKTYWVGGVCACIRGDRFDFFAWGGKWRLVSSLNLHLFLSYSTCSRVTKVATISRTSTTLKAGHNPACRTQTNELWEISGFWDSCTDKHHLPQVPLIMAQWWNQPSSSLYPYEPD